MKKILDQFLGDISMDQIGLYWALFGSAFALIWAFILLGRVMTSGKGTAKMSSIASAIQVGAFAYMKVQLLLIILVAAGFSVLLWFLFKNNIWIPIAFLSGVFLSLIVSYLGMSVAVYANIRTTAGASKSLSKGFSVACWAGSFIGLSLSALAILSIVGILFLIKYLNLNTKEIVLVLVAFAGGSSLFCIFARLGGGIFTKSADIGADLVGKIEAKIPEDDPRNPAVIADNVGDNVGDCAGTAADVFETKIMGLISILILSLFTFKFDLKASGNLISYVLLVSSMGLIGSLVGTLFLRLWARKVLVSLYGSVAIATVASSALLLAASHELFGLDNVFTKGLIVKDLMICAFLGYFATWAFMISTQYYTSFGFRPVQNVVEASKSGGATNIISGLSVGMESTFIGALIVLIVVFASFMLAGIMGIAFSVISMLSLAGIIMTMDSYGPISDNAGGIAEMSKLPSKVRNNTDKLDSVGNTTKAVTKGYVLGATVLGSFLTFQVLLMYLNNIVGSGSKPDFLFNLVSIDVFSGLIFGGVMPFLFGSLSMKSVGKAASAVVFEVRDQFSKNKGILTGKVAPDYSRTVSFLTKASMREMILPGMIPFMPIAIYAIVHFLMGQSNGVYVLGAILIGSTISGFCIASTMSIAGGAWDNAKKFIEIKGEKGSETHAASVTGDAVGDPCKDTSGPSINPMIKLTNVVLLMTAIWSYL